MFYRTGRRELAINLHKKLFTNLNIKIISVGIAFSGEIDPIRFRNSFSIKAYNACAGC